MKILVLGGNGFIGTHLVQRLSYDHEVTVFGRSEHSFKHERGKVKFIRGEFNDINTLSQALSGSEIVYHLLSSTNPTSASINPILDVENNLIGTIRFLELLKSYPIKKLIYVSSGGTVYGNPKYLPIDEYHPLNPAGAYGITKIGVELTIQRYAKELCFNYCIIRPSNPYGPGQRLNKSQGVIANFLHNAISNNVVEIWGSGYEMRDYIFIEDLVLMLYKVMDEVSDNNIYNVGHGKGTSTFEILEAVRTITGKKVNVVFKPKPNYAVEKVVLDITKARKHLNWGPRKLLYDGILEQYQWIKKHLDDSSGNY